MSTTMLVLLAFGVLVLGGLGFFLWRRMQPIKSERFQEQWKEVQKHCADKKQWRQAVIDADMLLDAALKKRRFGGRTMGERMVKAQRTFTDNDSVWFGHKLRSKLEADPAVTVKEDEVKSALIGIRQALKDLGALPK